MKKKPITKPRPIAGRDVKHVATGATQARRPKAPPASSGGHCEGRSEAFVLHGPAFSCGNLPKFNEKLSQAVAEGWRPQGSAFCFDGNKFAVLLVRGGKSE